MSSFLWYGFSTGINKGVLLVAIPLLSGILSLQDYGLWSLSQVIIVVCSTLVSLNGYSSILRFGVNDKLLGYGIFRKYFKYTLLIGGANLVFLFFYGVNWISLTFLLAQLEGFQVLLLGWCRSRDYYFTYFIISLIKITAIVLTVSFVEVNSLVELLWGQFIFGGIMLAGLYTYVFYKDNNLLVSKLKMKNFLLFSLYLIPHNIALWILSSSDRIIIKNILNEFELGLYSLAYSLALILMLLNSGIALTLPNYIIAKYDYYINSKLKIKLILLYSTSTILLNGFLYFFILFFKDKVFYFKEVDAVVYDVIVWVFNGIYLLGLYYFYSNILFYNKKAKLISLNTFFVSVLNVILTIIMVNYMGIKGAAIASFFAYLIYLISNIFYSFRLENIIIKDIPYLFVISIATITLNFYLIDFFPSLN